MTRPIDTGMNRTGIGTSPIDSRRTMQASHAAGTAGPRDGHVLEAERVKFSRSADPVGTVPPPSTVKGMAKTLMQKLQGHQPTVLIDKLGERLAFERTGTRLYEALIAKLEASDPHEGNPTRSDLEAIRDDERRHFALVRDAMLQIGADPTAMTPSADIVGVAALGWIQVLTDPRTTMTQCLNVILMAELADNDGWTMLASLADGLGLDDLVTQFRQALEDEVDHLMRVRAWMNTALLGQAGVQPTPSRPEAG